MGRWLIGPVEEFPPAEVPERHLFEVDGTEVGVFRVGDDFVAYRNWCPHQGGPACEGDVGARTIERIEDPVVKTRREFSPTELTLRCPWHGWEYDIRTGRSIADARFGLIPYRVERDGDDLYLTDD